MRHKGRRQRPAGQRLSLPVSTGKSSTSLWWRGVRAMAQTTNENTWPTQLCRHLDCATGCDWLAILRKINRRRRSCRWIIMTRQTSNLSAVYKQLWTSMASGRDWRRRIHSCTRQVGLRSISTSWAREWCGQQHATAPLFGPRPASSSSSLSSLSSLLVASSSWWSLSSSSSSLLDKSIGDVVLFAFL